MRVHFALVLALLPVSAWAQDAQVDKSVIAACFDKAPPGAVDPDCIGMAAGICEAKVGSTTVGISSCAMAEAAEWDTILNREYKATRDQFAKIPGISDQLQVAQRGWIALRDADCQIAYDRFEGGSMRSIASANCRMQHTAHRALELRNMREP
ncbi:lysozyme inhibitor LprI family protein [Paracoccus sp. PAR01]|uniref:lysozyme inhibitor LprI family protein n=1 Tax=Paracoccus sp. PAR01 TaxID=2769282 RepID=UPI00177FC8A9|nr:lysozyme inhibitor LprI family protein [Paracoccus sp. PAR01]MBD9526686.1 DUF1311 domain-containing protein [Paracoccus sp. PAR01]